MAKRQSCISLSLVLLRFAVTMLASMLLCALLWLGVLTQLQRTGIIYHGSVSNQQAEKMLAEKPDAFQTPNSDFLPAYGWFDRKGKVLESNASKKELRLLTNVLQQNTNDIHFYRYTYPDGTTLMLHWYYRREFVNPLLRRSLPPFEYLWWAILGIFWVLCLLLNTLWLGRRLKEKLKLFSQVSRKIGARELDFPLPHAGIREFDQALQAMDNMRQELSRSLSAQWTAQQERESEIAALTHDLKTPLTLIGGNAELLLEEDLPPNSRKMAETIGSANDRAIWYVTSLLEVSKGAEEPFVSASLPQLFEELCRSAEALAVSRGIALRTEHHLKGTANVQKDRLLRAFLNVVLNAVEHTSPGKAVFLEGLETENSWQIRVWDEGSGFSKGALAHATERLWRDDTSRSANSHHGLGLWFAAQVIKAHAGTLNLSNTPSGGMVTISFSSASK